MADATQFDHDRLSHLLADRLLRVPQFQRSYSWDQGNVDEFLNDLATARKKQGSYFMGTVVFANTQEDEQRQQIVDGQQRLATTAILLIAIRDLLADYKKTAQSKHIDETYLRGYDLESEDMVERLILNPDDQPHYDALLARTPVVGERSAIAQCYAACIAHLKTIASAPDDYRALVDITKQLDEDVQVLVAVASDLPEAYVIFETLNDRGADLTTADLLKNYLFSQAKQHFDYVQNTWVKVGTAFDKPEDLVKFIRYEYASRHGRVTTRKLYKAIQEDIGSGPSNAKKYLKQLDDAREVYAAIRDPDHARWNVLEFDVRDSLLAYRRFGFESSMPLLIAAFEKWDDEKAARLLNKVAAWSIRALFAGRIGASLSEEAFGEAAKAVSTDSAKNQDEVRAALGRLLPTNAELEQAVRNFGNVPVSRAKYLLAMLERAHRQKIKQSVEGLPDWSSKSVTIEHIYAKSSGKADAAPFVEQLGNFALLEKSLNRNLEDKPFQDKVETYAGSTFLLTREVAGAQEWGSKKVDERIDRLAGLAPLAWPL